MIMIVYIVYILYVQFSFTHRKISVSVYVALYIVIVSTDRFWAMVDRCSHLEYPLKTVAARASIVWFLALDAILDFDLADFLFFNVCFLPVSASRWGGVVFGFWLLWLLSCCSCSRCSLYCCSCCCCCDCRDSGCRLSLLLVCCICIFVFELGRCWQFSHRRALNCLARLTVFNWSWLESSVTSIVVDNAVKTPIPSQSHLPFHNHLPPLLPLLLLLLHLPCISFTLLSLCSLRLSIDCLALSLSLSRSDWLSVTVALSLSLCPSLSLWPTWFSINFWLDCARSLGGSYGKVFGTVNGSLLQLAVKQADAALYLKNTGQLR